MKKLNRGFTLIELLVVIAIIGILSSVVLASLNTSRTKGQIAAIKSNLANMMLQAELTYDDVGNYSTVCTTDSKIISMLANINSNGGTASCYSYDGTRWGVSAKLNSDNTKNFSVDSVGVVTWDTADTTLSSWSNACVASGGKLPSVEEQVSLKNIYNGNPPNFTNGYYWSNVTHPSDSSQAYLVHMTLGNVTQTSKTESTYVRCVK